MSEEEKKKVKRPKSTARKVIEWVLTGIFGALFLVLGSDCNNSGNATDGG